MNKKILACALVVSVAGVSYGCNEACMRREWQGFMRLAGSVRALGEDSRSPRLQQVRSTGEGTPRFNITWTLQDRHAQRFIDQGRVDLVEAEFRDTVVKTYLFCTGCGTYADESTEQCGYRFERVDEDGFNAGNFIRIEAEGLQGNGNPDHED